ncbi:DUF6318 family protein [Cellulomonas massiliensis]|uniref:DUF6318 family protein n=1 Tax=Cellulomonas massiliensis TaxID=1465811 RepID=UPI001FE689A3|nr:DUF6318 family protein [Cellulomonas massiliensis]
MLLAGGLAACSPADLPEPVPTTEPTSSSPQEPSDTPSPAEPIRPAAANSTDSAVATMRWVFDVYTYLLNTGDTAEFAAVSDPDCNYCANTLERAKTMSDAGQRVEGGVMTATGMSASGIGDDGYYTGRASVTRGPSTTYDSKNQIIDSVRDATDYDVQFSLQWTGDDWRVLEVEARPVDAP